MTDNSLKLRSYSQVVWTAEIDKAIGTDSDSAIGLRFGISPRAVRTRRKNLGRTYETSSDPIKWTKTKVRLLGTMPDTELASKLDVKVYWIRQKRAELGIAAHVIPDLPESSSAKEKTLVTPERIKLLGTVPDTVLAKRWGVTGGNVTRIRNSLAIPPFNENKPIEWTKGMLNLLGEISDNKLAKMYEVSNMTVKLKRIELDIPPFGKSEMDPLPEIPKHVIPWIGKIPDKQLSDQFKILRTHIRVYRALMKIDLAEYETPLDHEWTDQEEALLGTMSDGAVARKTQIPVCQVQHRRKSLGIAPFNRQGKVIWSKSRIERLGKEPDHLLSKEWRIPQSSVRKKREELGIRPCKRTARKWTRDEIKLLGTNFDTELAKQLGVSETLVCNKRKELNIPAFKQAGPFQWTQSMLKKLGKVPDDELAIEIGVSYQLVSQKRLELGIPCLRRSDLKWTKDIVDLLGRESDGAIAERLGCTVGLVRNKRMELLIAPYSRP